jgi:hypothetical protein
MNTVCRLVIATFILSTVAWNALHGHWEAVVYAKTPTGTQSLAIPLADKPLWASPPPPSHAEIATAFESGKGPPIASLFEHEREPPATPWLTDVWHRWSSWTEVLLSHLLLGSVLIVPLTFAFFRKDRFIGATGRLATGLLLAGALSLLLWLVGGGWGPPAFLELCVMGLLLGALWAGIFLERQRG